MTNHVRPRGQFSQRVYAEGGHVEVSGRWMSVDGRDRGPADYVAALGGFRSFSQDVEIAAENVLKKVDRARADHQSKVLDKIMYDI